MIDKNESYPVILPFRDKHRNILVYFCPFIFLYVHTLCTYNLKEKRKECFHP